MRKGIPLLISSPEDEAIIEPLEEYKYEKRTGCAPNMKYPKDCIICFQLEVILNAKKIYKLRHLENILDCELFEIKLNKKKIGLIKSGIGAAFSALLLERLIARGFKNFIIIGTGGCLDSEIKPGTPIIVEKSIRDEGTSYHYLKSTSTYVNASKSMTSRIKKSIDVLKFICICGSCWTTDAGYRETKKKAIKYKKMGVKVIDMESASLFAVSKFRKAKIGCILVVSDSITGEMKWSPHFHLNEVVDGLENSLKIAVNSFLN